jgi:hypothetical protein
MKGRWLIDFNNKTMFALFILGEISKDNYSELWPQIESNLRHPSFTCDPENECQG